MAWYRSSLILALSWYTLIPIGAAAQHLRIRVEPAAASPVLAVPTRELPRAARLPYRPIPDHRFLLAALEVSRLLEAGGERGVLAPHAGGWRLSEGEAEVGVLPELPGYADQMQFVAGWARRLLALTPDWAPTAGPPPAASDLAELERFEAPAVADAMRRLDAEWRAGSRSPERLRAAARGLIYLTLQQAGRTGVGEELPARAIATLALARLASAAPLPVEEALLARALGYGAAAESLAATLPAGDPVRVALLPGAEAPAVAELTTPLQRFLRLDDVATSHVESEWQRELGRTGHGSEISFGGLATALTLNRFSTNTLLPEAVLGLARAEADRMAGTGVVRRWLLRATANSVYRALASRPGAEVDSDVGRPPPPLTVGAFGLLARLALRLDAPGELAEALADYEASLARLDQKLPGPFLDAGTYGAFLRAVGYAGVDLQGHLALESFGSLPEARRFVASLDGAPDSTVAGDLRLLWQTLTLLDDGGPPDLALQALDRVSTLGAASTERLLTAYAERTGSDELSLLDAVVRQAARTDTRPAALGRHAGILRQRLEDITEADRYAAAGVRESGRGVHWLRLWRATTRGERATLVAAAGDSSAPAPLRATALNHLGFLSPTTSPEVMESYRAAIARDPANWFLRDDYIRLLERWGGHEPEAIEVVLGWRSRPGPRLPGLEPVFAANALARLYQARGDLPRAWAVIEPALPSYQAGALMRGASVLAAMGRQEEADALVDRALARYPMSMWARAAAAEIDWRAGRMAQAAERILRTPGARTTIATWRGDIAAAFARAVPVAKAAAAAAALARSGASPDDLNALANGLADIEQAGLAYQVLEASLAAPPAPTSWTWATLFSFHRRADGFGPALYWAQQRFPNPVPPQQLFYLFALDEPDAMWELGGDLSQVGGGEYFWLLRAADVAVRPAPDPARRDLLERHFRELSVDRYVALGRLLLGLDDPTIVLSLPADAHARCETAYFVGLRALAAGRHAEAVGWFRAAVETRSTSDGEYFMAWWALRRWAHPENAQRVFGSEGMPSLVAEPVEGR